MLFNEPKLLKYATNVPRRVVISRFSALQRAEIAEIVQRALAPTRGDRFSALQRAEIAEMARDVVCEDAVLRGFSALQRAEIAEISRDVIDKHHTQGFQCSSTSRNC